MDDQVKRGRNHRATQWPNAIAPLHPWLYLDRITLLGVAALAWALATPALAHSDAGAAGGGGSGRGARTQPDSSTHEHISEGRV